MSLFEAIFLGIVQGITEFLPISSSGHLILVESWLQLDVESLKGFDIAVHFGTLVAIFAYFWKDYVALLDGLWAGALKEKSTDAQVRNQRIVAYLCIATVPAVLAGLFLNDWLDLNFRNSFSVAVVLIVVGVFFFIAEKIGQMTKKRDYTVWNTLLVGAAQALALIPGVSRSGITVSTGLTAGLSRVEGARFSFLLGSVAITAATFYGIWQVTQGDFVLPGAAVLLAGVASSAISGYLAVRFLMSFFKKHSLAVFGVYRIVLGLLILIFWI